MTIFLAVTALLKLSDDQVWWASRHHYS